MTKAKLIVETPSGPIETDLTVVDDEVVTITITATEIKMHTPTEPTVETK